MTSSTSKLRKAAVLIRSLDPQTAAGLLGQLSTAEAAAIRQALRELGPVDPDEQADVLAEFQRRRPLADEPPATGVELAISPAADIPTSDRGAAAPKRFQFLEQAPIEALLPYLAREHAQTVAVVLSHLAPERAAAVLAGLPVKLQASTIERMSSLGDGDPESVTALERELAAWVAKQRGAATSRSRAHNPVTSILEATAPETRSRILHNLRSHNPELERKLSPSRARQTPEPVQPAVAASAAPAWPPKPDRVEPSQRMPLPPAPAVPAPRLRLRFDDLINLDGQTLAAVLQQADPRVLTLALAGSPEELIDRICDEMPKQTARAFRRKLLQLGPTRLSDVEAAQHAVADLAARQLAARRRMPALANGI